MKDFPFNTVSLSADDVQALEDSYKALKAKFNIGLPGAGGHINKFELFNNEKEASLSGTLLINSPSTDCYLNFVKIRYQFTAGKTSLNYLKCQVWAFVNLKKDFGRILIRKETFADRVLQVLHPIELKFKDDKEFNSKFYVVTNDQDKALSAMTSDFRNAVMVDIKDTDLVIEIIKDTLVIRNIQPINPEQTLFLADFAGKLVSL